MQFLKRHYEKIVLTLVLLGLVGAAVWLFIRVGKVKDDLDATLKQIETTSNPGKLALPDFATYTNALTRVGNPPRVDLAHGHPVVNPVRWQIKPNGDLLKIQSGKEVGPDAVTVAKVMPLDLVLTLLDARGTTNSPSYSIQIERQNATKPGDRTKMQRSLSPSFKISVPLDTATLTVTLKEVKGTFPDAPEIVVEVALPDGPEMATLTKEKAWSKTLAYSADLLYPPEGGDFKGKRVNDSITVAAEPYKIIAISTNQVVLSAANDKRFLIPYKPAP